MCGFCLQCSESVKPLNLNLSMQARDSRQDSTRRASSVEDGMQSTVAQAFSTLTSLS